ncbi:MAG: efflux RND transporter permease subunit [Gammaproteobacteria bacterium]
MKLSDLCIERPVLATVMSLLLVLLGAMSVQRLPVREYPNIDTPIVSVSTVYTGASAAVIESQVTRPLEDSLAGIEGVKVMKSVSREEISRITIEFELSRNPDAAAADVRDRVSRVRGRLPDDVDEPVISKVEADAQAIIWLAFASSKHNALEITDFADRQVKDRLQTLPGVASVVIGGERRYAMRLWIDRELLAAHGLTVKDVEDALRERNVELPAGRIESKMREFTVLSETDLRTPEQFNALILREVDGRPVRLQDVGRAELGAVDERNEVRVNGQPAVGLGIVKQSTANTLAVANAVKAELPAIKRSLPEGMTLTVAFDTSLFVERSIHEVIKTLAEALSLVILVTFVFLRSWRATVIPFVTIPVSLIGAFIFMDLAGFTINVMTLLALVLAIGLVVDDAIVVLENVHRRIERGMKPKQAAFEGSREIAFAVIAMTLTLATVFAPLAFLSGNTGRLFSEFALAVSAAVLVSGFVALTLTPMMCSQVLKADQRYGFFYRFGEIILNSITRAYGRLVEWTVAPAAWLRAHLPMLLRWLMVVLVFALIGAAIARYAMGIKRELSPLEDRSFVMAILNSPDGATMAYTRRYARQVEQFVSEIPEVQTAFVVVAPGLERPNQVTQAIGFIVFKPWDERTRKQQDIQKELQPRVAGLPGVTGFVLNPPSLGQNFRTPPIQYVIQADSYDTLQKAVDALTQRARAYPGLVNVDSDLKLNKPQFSVTVDRDRAADLGVEVSDIGHTLGTLLGGRQITRFKHEGEQYDVIVELSPEDRATTTDLSRIYVRGKNDQLVQLDNLVQVDETVAARELNHFNRQRSATISAALAPGTSLGEALTFLDKAAAEVLPPSARTTLDGQSREFRESSSALYMVFAMAMVFIYLVLAAQFESFIDPFVILLTVPLAVCGALVTLKANGGTLNVYSQIGLVMLVGLITKNGILIVEFANQLQLRGRAIRAAVTEAASLRLRPILMTTFAMVLGSLPLALSESAGAESRQQIGWVIVGGLSVGTLLTLFVIPVVYILLARDHGVRRMQESNAAAVEVAASTVVDHLPRVEPA